MSLKISVILTVLITVVAVGLAAGQVESEAEVLDLARLVREALANNPDIVAMQHRLEALRHRVKPAEALPDPAAGFALMSYPVGTNPFDIGRFPMTQTQISLSQKFPAPGVRRLRGELARQDIGIAAEQLSGKEVAIAAEIGRIYFDLYINSRHLKTFRATADEFNRIIETAESRYEAGSVRLRDVLKARLALSRLETMIEAFEQQFHTLKAELNVILNRDPGAELAGPPAELLLTPVSMDFTAAMNEAVSNNPALLAATAEIDKRATGIQLALKALQPDYGLNFAYGIRDGVADLWTAGITVNLPLWRGSKQREYVAETEAESRLATAAYLVEKNRVALAIRKALDEIERADAQIKLYRESNIPLARMALEATATAYRTNRAELDDLLDDRIVLLNLELELEQTIAEREKSIIGLYQALGKVIGTPTEKDSPAFEDKVARAAFADDGVIDNE
ncbi:MAG TPA: TolC family protein [Acidobacteriota bacterium]|nr:TolC family protein [Acidobacteriota bacterium]